MEKQKKVSVQSVKRALDILDFLTREGMQGGAATLSEVAAAIGVADTTAHNILKSMQVCGYVGQNDDRRYRLGPKCRDLARSATLGAAGEAVTAILKALADKTGESVVLTTLINGQRYEMMTVSGPSLVRVSNTVESGQKFWSLVTARVLAAYVTAPERMAIVEQYGYPQEIWDGIGTAEQLQPALATIQQAGQAQKTTTEVAAYAVPVLDSQRRISAALGIYFPVFRANDDHVGMIVQELKLTAQRIAAAL